MDKRLNTFIITGPEINQEKYIKITGKDKIIGSYDQYLKDESRLQGQVPETICFPETTEQVARILIDVKKRDERITVSGSRTGIVGGAVNIDAENLMSLENLVYKPVIGYNNEHECWSIRVGAGYHLNQIQSFLKEKGYIKNSKIPANLYYPIDPTEISASAGGMVATNASGARTYYYGPTRDWVLGMSLVLADGSILKIKRGQCQADGYNFICLKDKKKQVLNLPELNMPSTKHTAGYFIKKNMDLIDLFIGGEGTLGIITDIEFKLTCLPQNCLYLCLFMPEKKVLPLIEFIKKSSHLKSLAIEYMDTNSMQILKNYRKEQGEASHVPDIKQKNCAMVYLELPFSDKDNFNRINLELQKLLHRLDIADKNTWAGINNQQLTSIKQFRHALPERINTLISARKREIPQLTKIGTDMAVPDNALGQMMQEYSRTLSKHRLEYCIFGHIGNGHVHVNILPKNLKELHKAKSIYYEFARLAVRLRGSISAEHGIGRMKKNFLPLQFKHELIKEMVRIKKFFDPENRLNPGVLF